MMVVGSACTPPASALKAARSEAMLACRDQRAVHFVYADVFRVERVQKVEVRRVLLLHRGLLSSGIGDVDLPEALDILSLLGCTQSYFRLLGITGALTR